MSYKYITHTESWDRDLSEGKGLEMGLIESEDMTTPEVTNVWDTVYERLKNTRKIDAD